MISARYSRNIIYFYHNIGRQPTVVDLCNGNAKNRKHPNCYVLYVHLGVSNSVCAPGTLISIMPFKYLNSIADNNLLTTWTLPNLHCRGGSFFFYNGNDPRLSHLRSPISGSRSLLSFRLGFRCNLHKFKQLLDLSNIFFYDCSHHVIANIIAQ